MRTSYSISYKKTVLLSKIIAQFYFERTRCHAVAGTSRTVTPPPMLLANKIFFTVNRICFVELCRPFRIFFIDKTKQELAVVKKT